MGGSLLISVEGVVGGAPPRCMRIESDSSVEGVVRDESPPVAV